MGTKREGPCVVINCGDDHHGHKKKSNCCDVCETAGEESRFSGAVDLGTISPVGTEIAFAILENPLGSGKNIIVTNRGLAVTGSDDETALVKYYFDPVVTLAGAPAAAVNLNQQTPPLPAGVAVLTMGPTISSTGTLIDALNTGSGQSELSGKLVLGEGHSLLVTGRANAENTRAAAFLYWQECVIPMEPTPEP